MKVYFSDCKKIILEELSKAQEEVLIAVSWLTDREIYALLKGKLEAGVVITIITRNDYLNNHENALPWNEFISLGGRLYFCVSGKMLHYKFAVIDGSRVIATSYNWTCFSGSDNRENIMVFKKAEEVTPFIEEHHYLTTCFSLVTQPARISPQDFNPALQGFYNITLENDEKNQSIKA